MIKFELSYRKSYYIKHPIRMFKEIYSYIYDVVYRGFHGHAPSDSFSLFSYLNSWMPTAIRNVKKYGYPICMHEEIGVVDYANITKEQSEQAKTLWYNILEKIALGFEASKLLDEEMICPDDPRYETLHKQMDEGLQLFVKHYESLWY